MTETRNPMTMQLRSEFRRILADHNIECTGPGEVTCIGCRDAGWMSWSEYRSHVADALLAVTVTVGGGEA